MSKEAEMRTRDARSLKGQQGAEAEKTQGPSPRANRKKKLAKFWNFW